MAIPLPPDLAAKVTASGQQPELSVTVQDLVTRLSLHASGGMAGRSAAILSSSGTVLRAVVHQGVAAAQPLYVQRISPTVSSDWSAAGTLVTGSAMLSAGCCLVQSGGTTRLFYQRLSDSCIVYRDSADDGQTWGAESATNGSLPAGMSICAGIAADSLTEVWAAWYQYDEAPTGLYRMSGSGGWSAWSNEGPSSPGPSQMRGLAVTTAGGIRYFAAGVAMRGYLSGISAACWTWDGSSYSNMSTIQEIDSPSAGLTCDYPDIVYDGAAGVYWATVTLTDEGTVSGNAHTRTSIYSSADGVSWIPYLSAGTALQDGAHLLHAGGTTYVFDGATCYTVPAPPAAIDLSDDVLRLQIAERFNQPGRLALQLSNENGRYTGAAWLSDNATVTLSLGYGGQTVHTHTFYIDDWQITSTATECALTLAGRDSLKLLDYPSTRLLVYQNQTVAQILAQLALQARVSIDNPPATAQFSQTLSCFLVSPGETFLSALRRLSAVFGFLFFSSPLSSVSLMDPQEGDKPSWSYGTEMLASSMGREADVANVVRVTGTSSSTTPVWSEVADSDSILFIGREIYRNVVDRMLTTGSQCGLRAAQELRAEQRSRLHGELTVALNPAHQLGDVITATDAETGLSNTALRINAMRWSANLQTGAWEHHLGLEAP